MKFNKITDATKILLMAATIIITCIIIAIGFSVARSAEKLGRNAGIQISRLDKDISESGLMAFDKTVVNGSEVVNLIKEILGEYEYPSESPVYIYVKTSIGEYTHKNNKHFADIRNFSLNNGIYIKPTGKFLGEVKRNANDVIEGIVFVQQ